MALWNGACLKPPAEGLDPDAGKAFWADGSKQEGKLAEADGKTHAS